MANKTHVSNERLKIRAEYTRQRDAIPFDNIPSYADWLEECLAGKLGEVRKLKEALNKTP